MKFEVLQRDEKFNFFQEKSSFSQFYLSSLTFSQFSVDDV